VWDKLRTQTAVEREQLHRLLETHRPLLDRCRVSAPSAIELSALAAMLHSFYSGIENILKRIAAEIDGAVPVGETWHREVLEAMTEARPARQAAISRELGERLGEYPEFRHFFRHAYTFDLRWEKMRPLVMDCDQTLQQLEAELDSFLRRAG
jgi:hypothetical protein